MFGVCVGEAQRPAEVECSRLAPGDHGDHNVCSCWLSLPPHVHPLLRDVGGEQMSGVKERGEKEK